MIKLAALGATAATVIALAVPAAADDRQPTAAERQQIEAALQEAGFVSWEEIELDDDGPYWDVDDARTAQGLRYDLKLDPQTLAITHRDQED